MAIPTKYRLAEEILKMLNGGNIQTATNVSIPELIIAIGQAANSLLKIDIFQVNLSTGETIPNGTVIGTYEGIVPQSLSNGRSKATLPIKPMKLPRNMGIWSVYLSDDPENEFIPLQMGQANMIRSQRLINGLLGQVGYENDGMNLTFTKDLPLLFPGKPLTIKMAILDMDQYDEYDILPIPPELEFQIKEMVLKMYSGVGGPDKLVDPTTKDQQGVPIKQQQQN